METFEEIYKDFRKKSGKTKDEKTSKSVGIFKAFTHNDYRFASWIVVYIMLAFNFSGIPVINIYTNDIFADIKKAGGHSIFSPTQ